MAWFNKRLGACLHDSAREALPLLIVISPALTMILACVFFARTWALHRILPRWEGRDA